MDIALDAWVTALSSPVQPDPEHLGRWLAGVARLKSHELRRVRLRRLTSTLITAAAIDPRTREPGEIAGENEEASAVRSALAAIAPPDRSLLEHRYQGDAPIGLREFARSIGVSRRTAAARDRVAVRAFVVALLHARRTRGEGVVAECVRRPS